MDRPLFLGGFQNPDLGSWPRSPGSEPDLIAWTPPPGAGSERGHRLAPAHRRPPRPGAEVPFLATQPLHPGQGSWPFPNPTALSQVQGHPFQEAFPDGAQALSEPGVPQSVYCTFPSIPLRHVPRLASPGPPSASLLSETGATHTARGVGPGPFAVTSALMGPGWGRWQVPGSNGQ